MPNVLKLFEPPNVDVVLYRQSLDQLADVVVKHLCQHKSSILQRHFQHLRLRPIVGLDFENANLSPSILVFKVDLDVVQHAVLFHALLTQEHSLAGEAQLALF